MKPFTKLPRLTISGFTVAEKALFEPELNPQHRRNEFNFQENLVTSFQLEPENLDQKHKHFQETLSINFLLLWITICSQFDTDSGN